MKKLSLLILAVMLIVACKNQTETPQEESTEMEVVETSKNYPKDIARILEAHGGIDKWNDMQGLYYGIEREDFVEKHSINLKNRKSLIEYDHHHLGFDGENVWIKNLDTVTYKSNPKFYYNLMFYFYAMPFVLADDGINYSVGPEIEVGDKTYAGILISYNEGIGESPEDEYVLFYDPETYKMEWLGYTVTFFSKEKGKKFNLIKYDDWADVNGFMLPTTLQWHHFEDGVIGDMRNEMKFVTPKLTNEAPNDELFVAPEGATIAE